MGLLFFILILGISSVWANHQSKYRSNHEKINLEAIVNRVNSDHTSLWKADTYGSSEIDAQEIRKKLGAKLRKTDKSTANKFTKSQFFAHNKPKLKAHSILPESYDARQRYPNCTSISHIRDQSACGSCWAVSAASMFSDRLCIHSKGRYNYELSSRYILSCDKSNFGCNGGYLDTAWEFLKKKGTVTGGEFDSDEGCQPYPMFPCGWPTKRACPLNYYFTPKCLKHKCDNEMYEDPEEENPIKAMNSYLVNDGGSGKFNEYFIREEIFFNGPVQAGFDVYVDLLTYKSGIYYPRLMKKAGGHAVKIIGWGEEKGVKYWLIANSWGDDWGENGTFRMLRGRNCCKIEDEIYGGNPIIDG